MGVQAGDPGSLSDPGPTAAVPVVPVVSNSGQGVLFHEAHGYPTFGDTDKIPVVTAAQGRGRGPRRDGNQRPERGRRRGRGSARAPRWLRLAVVIVTLVILAAAAVLGLVKAGVIDGNGKGENRAASGTAGSTQPATTKSLLTATGTTASGAANYTIGQHVYRVTVTTSVGRSWVVIGAVGQQPAFAGIVPANSSQRETILGPAQVQVGAGGTKVIVTSGRSSQTLIPPSAPFSYQITPA
jgi:hypothetical protein